MKRGTVELMRKILLFRRSRPSKRRLKSLDEFADPPWKGRTRFWPPDNRVTARGLIRDTTRWLGLLAAAGIVWLGVDPGLVEPPAFLATEPELVSEQFTLCREGGRRACVVDGDTFRLGNRRIRIIGIDAPETHPSRCEREARLGETAAVRLQVLLNEAPFEMVGRLDEPTDRYGRELKSLRQLPPDGSKPSIAERMRGEGHARANYGFKRSWC